MYDSSKIISAYSKSLQRCDANWLNATLHCNVRGSQASQYQSRKPIVNALLKTLSRLSSELNEGKTLRRLGCWGGSAIPKVPQHIHLVLEKPINYDEDCFGRTFCDYMDASASEVFNKRTVESTFWCRDFDISESQRAEHFVSYMMRGEGSSGINPNKVIIDLLYLN
jgi:hypothetical protein